MPPAAPPPEEPAAGRGRVRFGSGTGSMSSKGAMSPPSEGKSEATSAPESGPEAPKAEDAAKPEEKDLSGDLDQFAPLDMPQGIFGPKAIVYRGEISFRVKLRDGAAKPAEEGAKP